MRLRLGKKKDNRGMSLVEVLCAVAIFALVAVVVSGVVVVSSRIYRNGVSEASLQQEAQYLTNQIGNLVKDANKVEKYGTEVPATGYYICTTDKEGYLLKHDATAKIINYYTYTTDGAGNRTLSAPALLAEHVKTFTMNYPDFESTRAVRLTLQMDNGSKTYDMDYTMTARNEVVQTIEFSEIPEVNIECENQIYLVPGETWNLPVIVSGETGGIDIECPTGVSTTKTHYAQNESLTNLPIKLESNVTDSTRTLIIKTTRTVSEGSLAPLKSIIVTINVRRVNAIQVKSAVDVTGTAHNTYEEAGSIFTFYSEADIYHAARRVGKAWDNEWKQPAAVEWSAELNINGIAASVSEYFEKLEEVADAGTPMVKYRLKKDMPAGLEFTVKAVSLHRRGENKNGASYCDLSGEDKDIYGINTVKPRETKISGTAYMVLEPNQTGSVTPSVSMLGGVTNNILCELVGATDTNTTASYADGQLTVKLGTDEMGITQSYINKNGGTSNGSGIIKAVLYSGDRVYSDPANKTDTANVYIFVRRVTGLDLNYKIMSGDKYPVTTPFKKDTTYQFRTRIDGTNLETLWFEADYVDGQDTDDKIKIDDYCKRFGIEFTWKVKQPDKEPSMVGTVYWMDDGHNTQHLPYKNDGKTKADFFSGQYKNSNLQVMLLGFNNNGPCINVKLLTDYPADTEFEVTATVLHTKGMYSFNGGTSLRTNQTGVQYASDISRTVSLNNVIEFKQGCIVADPTQGQNSEAGDTVHMMRIPIEVKTRINKLLPRIEGNQKEGTKVLTKLTQSCSEGGTGYVYIAIDKDEQESSDLKLIVKATAVKDQVGDTPLAEIEIPIHIRRVTNVTVEKISGDNSADSTMVFEATAGGINDVQYFQPHRSEDGTELYPWDKKQADYIGYMTPYAWQWSISFDEGENWHDFTENADNQLVIDPNNTELNKYIKEIKGSGIKQEKESSMSSKSLITERQRTLKITLKEKLPANSKIRVTSLHAAGSNRGGRAYGIVEDIYTIKDRVLIDCNIERGTETQLTGFAEDYNNLYRYYDLSSDSKQRQFFRYREIGSEWTNTFHQMKGNYDKPSWLTHEESLLFQPDKEYEIEVICVVFSEKDKKVYWPHDESLFEKGKGWTEAGYTKGWSDNDVTDTSLYQRNYYIGAAQIVYGKNEKWGVEEGSSYFGDYGRNNPVQLNGALYGNGSDRLDFNIQTRYLCQSKKIQYYMGKIDKLEEDNTWTTIVEGTTYNDYRYMENKYHFFVNMSLGAYQIYNIHEKELVEGNYRVRMYIENMPWTKQEGTLMNPNYVWFNKSYDMYDLSDDTGVFYFHLN